MYYLNAGASEITYCSESKTKLLKQARIYERENYTKYCEACTENGDKTGLILKDFLYGLTADYIEMTDSYSHDCIINLDE